MGIKLNIKDIDINELDPQEKIEMQEAADYFRASAAAHKQNAKEMRRVFLITGIIVLALAIVFFAIMAWFANNKAVYGQGMSLNSTTKEINLGTCDVYYINKNASGSLVYKRNTFTSLKDIDLSSVDMYPFDSLLGSNSYTPIYISIPLKTEELDDESITNLVYASIDVQCDSNAKWVDSSVAKSETRYLSSIISVTTASIKDVTIYSTNTSSNNKKTYNKIRDGFKAGTDTSEKTRYVTGGQSYASKSSSTGKFRYTKKKLNYNIPVDYLTVKTDSDNKHYTYLFVKVDYSSTLVKGYLGFVGDDVSRLNLDPTVKIEDFFKDTFSMTLYFVRKTE